MRRWARRSSSSKSPSRVWPDQGSLWQEGSTLVTDRHPHWGWPERIKSIWYCVSSSLCGGAANPARERRKLVAFERFTCSLLERGCVVLTVRLITLSGRFRSNGSSSRATDLVGTPSSYPLTETRASEKLPAYIIGGGLLPNSTSGGRTSPTRSWTVRATTAIPAPPAGTCRRGEHDENNQQEEE